MRLFAWPIFRLTALTFRSQKRNKLVKPGELFSSPKSYASLVSKYEIH